MPSSTGFARTHAVALHGMQGHVVEVQAHLAHGLPSFVITGLGDTAVGQARDRVRAAVLNAGQTWPAHRITVGLCPAWLPKHGSAFDVAIALAILAAAGSVSASAVENIVALGELGLDGSLRTILGVLPRVLAAQAADFSTVVVPSSHTAEARLVPDMHLIPVVHLAQGVSILKGESEPDWTCGSPNTEKPDAAPLCFSDVVGQQQGRWAMEIAAAGGHNAAFFGPPGAGKTMIAERLPGILPSLCEQEALEVTAIHSVAGRLRESSGLITIPPFQAPHHTATVPALVGGGNGQVHPGAVSLAHRGVLFLDEAMEFAPKVLDALREPLERGEIAIARASGITIYPARVQLILAANPCPCGAARFTECECGSTVRRRYMGRISGPLLDRVDMQITLPPVTPAALYEQQASESTLEIARRVLSARDAASERWRENGWATNAQAAGSVLRSTFRLPRSATQEADRALESGVLTARGYDRVLRVAWTLADLAGRISPGKSEVAQATELRLRLGH